MRFYIYRETFRDSFIHPSESLFIGASLVSFGTILLNVSQYGVEHAGEWLDSAVLVLFWFYCGTAVVGSLGIYLVMWSTQTFTVSKMTPVWIFPAYPLLIVGPHAGLLTATLPQKQCLPVIIGGVALQGTGFMVSMMIYSAFIYRLMTQKLPKEALRPGMFVSVGPAAFTVSALILIGDNLERSFPPDFMGDGKLAAFVLKITASFWGAWLWGLALWFFLSSVGAHWSSFRRGHMHFVLPFWSFIFPQTALVTATFAIGKSFSCRPIQIVGVVMSVVLLLGWFIVLGLMIRAIYLRQILWPQQGEDKDEGGFKRGSI
ncbi:MAG: hypothetical protein M1814_000283 [Vezdaea aestivalis]|nr:MAG: hypothetical protein M1814_000283 [Vezdaea aestivalis]